MLVLEIDSSDTSERRVGIEMELKGMMNMRVIE